MSKNRNPRNRTNAEQAMYGAGGLLLRAEPTEKLDKINHNLKTIEGYRRIASGRAFTDEERAMVDDLNELIELYGAELAAESVRSEAAELADAAAVFRFLKGGGNATVELRDGVTLISSTATDGAEAVPSSLHARFVEKLQAHSPVLKYASIVPTAGGAPLAFPTVSSFSTVYTPGEAQPLADADTATGDAPQFETVTLRAKKLAVLAMATNELFQDAAEGGGERFILDTLAASMAVGLDQRLMTGDGIGDNPTGLDVAGGALGATAAAVQPVAADLLALMQSVPVAARMNGTFIIADSLLAGLRADTSATHLWSYHEGVERFAGRPVEADEFLGDVSGYNGAVFGDISKFAVRMTPLRLESNRTGPAGFETDLTQIRALVRVGSGLIQPDAVKSLRLP